MAHLSMLGSHSRREVRRTPLRRSSTSKNTAFVHLGDKGVIQNPSGHVK